MRTALFVVIFLLKSMACFAQNDICLELTELSKVKVEQSNVSQLIFGVQREREEIYWISKAQNKISTGRTNKNFYMESQKCLEKLNKNNGSISVQRNFKIIEIELLWGLANSTRRRFLNDEFKEMQEFLLTNINTDDYMLSTSIIQALGVFSSNEVSDVLFTFILNDKNRLISRKDAAHSLSFIYSDYSRKKITELKRLSKGVQW